MTLQDVKDELAMMAYGMTRSEALKQNICIQCKESITENSFYTANGKLEYQISGLCEHCYDKTTGG